MKTIVRVVLAICLLSIASYVRAQTNAVIAGTARDATGAVLPGVTVEVSSPALIERVRTATTDETGQYKILELRPGTYAVHFSLPGFSSVRREGIDHLRPDRFAGLPELPELSPAGRGEAGRSRAGIGWMGLAFDESAPLQQDEHGPHGAGIGRHAPRQFPLREGIPFGQRRQEHELVGRDALRGEPRIRPAVQRQVRGTQGHRELAPGRHRFSPDTVVRIRTICRLPAAGGGMQASPPHPAIVQNSALHPDEPGGGSRQTCGVAALQPDTAEW